MPSDRPNHALPIRRSSGRGSGPWGEEHGAWKGDAASEHTKRQRARRLYPTTGPCQRCGATSKTERHHVDANPGNNTPENILIVCRRCHQAIDGRLEAATARLVASARTRPRKRTSCCNCEREYKPLRQGRCSPCYLFWRKRGRDILPDETRNRSTRAEVLAGS